MPASPQTDQGFVMIALDLWGALVAARLTDPERLVLGWVLAACYGPEKADGVGLDLVALEELTGVHRNNLRAGLKSLIAKGIVGKGADQRVRFIKDFESWAPFRRRPEDGPGPGRLAFCRAILARFGLPRRKVQSANVPMPVHCDESTCEANVPMPIHSQTPVKPNADSLTLAVGVNESALPAIIDEAPARLNSEKRDRRSEDSTSSTTTRPTRPIRDDPAEVSRIADWADALDPLAFLGGKVREFSTSYPADWIEDALIVALSANPAPGKAWKYAIKCLLGWWEAGRKTHAEVEEAWAKVRAGPVATPRRDADADLSPYQRRRKREVEEGLAWAAKARDDDGHPEG